jgi:hypothetical protein
MKIPGGIPAPFADIPTDREGFSFSFPFVFNQDVMVSTPKGFRTIAVPAKNQSGDGKAMLSESIVHWAKKARLEASSKWTVRATTMDPALASRILDQLAMAHSWSDITIPLRK